jgi:hypothetical protein
MSNDNLEYVKQLLRRIYSEAYWGATEFFMDAQEQNNKHGLPDKALVELRHELGNSMLPLSGVDHQTSQGTCPDNALDLYQN